MDVRCRQNPSKIHVSTFPTNAGASRTSLMVCQSCYGMRPPDQRKWLVRICQGGASAPCHVLRRRHGQGLGDVGNLEIQILMRYNYCGSEHCATRHVICLGDARVLADRTKHQSTRDTGVDTVECIRARFHFDCAYCWHTEQNQASFASQDFSRGTRNCLYAPSTYAPSYPISTL